MRRYDVIGESCIGARKNTEHAQMRNLPPSTPLLSAVKFFPIKRKGSPTRGREASKLAFRKKLGVNVSMTSI